MTKYYETVFEGKHDTIEGLLTGFLMGVDRDWDWFMARDVHIEAETFSEAIMEWASLKSKLHHVIIEEEFLKALEKAGEKHSHRSPLEANQIKSVKEIKSAEFKFKTKTYAKKYGDEIKEIMQELPKELELLDFKETVDKDSNAKGVELYTPAHDYEYHSQGKAVGSVKEIIQFRQKLDAHPLVEVSRIKLNL